MRSDKDDFHDHPFSFLGYVVSKGYEEVLLDATIKTESTNQCSMFADLKESDRKEGTFAYRKATDIHKVFTDRPYLAEEYKDAPLTVIFRGPIQREWGFWKRTAPKHYVWEYWRDYLNVPDSDVRE
jgi:hypothetical protein